MVTKDCNYVIVQHVQCYLKLNTYLYVVDI